MREVGFLFRLGMLVAVPIASSVAWPSRDAMAVTYACAADCNGNDAVTISELTTAKGIALNGGTTSGCNAADVNGDGTVTVSELVLGVNFAVGGCPLRPNLTVDTANFTPQEHVSVLMPSPYQNFHVLRVGVGTPNTGTGRFEVVGGMQTMQRLYNGAGVGQSVPIAGEVIYHPEHNHVHFNNWVKMRLIDADTGAIAAEGAKLSFCIEDTVPHTPSPPAALYEDVCTSLTQGISPGWKDVYSKTCPGQFLDIDGVPAGEYYIEANVDPDRRLVETNTADNDAWDLIDLGGVDSTTDCRGESPDCCALAGGVFDPVCARCKEYFCYLGATSACEGLCSGCPPEVLLDGECPISPC